jgi:predicted nuclease of predicted toxin-antitoxin system
MRFLANENIPLTSVRHLREANYDTAAVIEDSPGATDREILVRAVREERIIVTFDRDYGELIYRYKFPVPPGVVYLRFDPLTPQEPGVRVLQLLNSDLSLERKFTVLEHGRIRQRPLP